MTGAEKYAVQVDRQNLVPEVEGGFLGGPFAQDAGTTHQYIDVSPHRLDKGEFEPPAGAGGDTGPSVEIASQDCVSRGCHQKVKTVSLVAAAFDDNTPQPPQPIVTVSLGQSSGLGFDGFVGLSLDHVHRRHITCADV